MKDTPTLQILRRARARLERPKGWTQGTMTRYDKHRKPVSYCLLGALYGDSQTPPVGYRKALSTISKDLEDHQYYSPEGAIINFNDSPSTRKKDVLAALDRAIAKLEKQVTT